MTRIDARVKRKGSITKFRAPGEGDSNIAALVLLVIGGIVVLAIAIAIVVIMVEFCGGLWLRLLSQDLFSGRVDPQVYTRVYRCSQEMNFGDVFSLIIGGSSVQLPRNQGTDQEPTIS